MGLFGKAIESPLSYGPFGATMSGSGNSGGRVRCSIEVRNLRRILCVFPRYTQSFGPFSHAYKLVPGVRAFMPPQGLLLIAAYLPATWQVRFVDENIRPATAAELAWADVVMVSGMHVQAPRSATSTPARKRARKVTGWRPRCRRRPKCIRIDYLHVGDGRRTDRLPRRREPAPPSAQNRFTIEITPLRLSDPAYLSDPAQELPVVHAAFSSGCPYRCEFCDIPGRPPPRLKTPQQIIAEPTPCSQPRCPTSVYFVTTISSATARRPARCCRRWCNGRSTAIRCYSPARRR
jgi:hypothetical protein